jgi:hypothetical protein
MRLSSPWVGRRPRGTHNPTMRRLGRSDILIREPVREVCLNSARQLITRGHGKEQNATQRFRKCLQLLRNVQLEKSVGWTQNPPGFGPWGFDSPSRHHRFQKSYPHFMKKVKCTARSACVRKVCAESFEWDDEKKLGRSSVCYNATQSPSRIITASP